MAGIAGIVHPNRLQTNRDLEPMLDTLSHRAETTESHIFQEKNIEFGICGGKYLEDEKKSLVVAFDGKLWRREKLINSLRQVGFQVNGDSTEHLILSAYECWGEKFLQQLDGDFVLVLYDRKRETLLIARDRVGVKPLYWYHDQSHLIFASELKALLATSYIPQTPSSDGIASYFTLGYIPQDMTPIKNVNKLLPSYYILYQLNKTKSIVPYWSFSSYFTQVTNLSLSEALEESVLARQLPGKEAIHQKTLPLNTPDLDGFFSRIGKIIWYLDEPVALPSLPSIWNLTQLLSDKNSLFFSNIGADLLFAPRKEADWSSETTKEKSLLAELLKLCIYKFHLKSPFYWLKFLRTPKWHVNYLKTHSLATHSQLKKMSPSLARIFDPETFLHKFHHLDRLESPITSGIYLDVKTTLPDRDLLILERLFGAYKISWCAPYTDARFLEIFAEQSSQGYIDETLTPSIDQWNPTVIASHPTFQSALSELSYSTLVETGLISGQWLSHNTASPKRITQAFPLLWAVFMLELWFRLFINRPVLLGQPYLTLEEILGSK